MRRLGLTGGKVIALIEPNDARKPTLLAVMARLQKPSAGTVAVDGIDVHRADSSTIACKLAVLRFVSPNR
ncbi:hypothetical protein O6R08_07730 [Cutibacterium equinum]|uniref:ABC transporter domain-containing protein n=1 Tax=Cutibacterium equinum TaxID=3016342 RepID=A0ABY7QXI3_9ACTN|nr:hypothetical protein [Cutibacterium equinum]WCC79410.1 hypothetical protein O6R08_07730 [Cutibacterium equinum]